MLRHIVVFNIRNPADVKPALKKLRALCQSSSLLADWRVERSLDSRKGSVIIQNTLLKEGVSIDEWREAPDHLEVVKFMSQVADWQIADYEE